MAHELNKRMQKDIVDAVYLGVNGGHFTWPEIVMAVSEVAGRIIGESVDTGIQAKEIITIAQRFMVQAAHTAHEAKSGNASLIIPG